MPLSVGQKLYHPRLGDLEELVVTHVARKWATVEHQDPRAWTTQFHVDKNTLRGKDENPGIRQCFLSPEDYEEYLAAQEAEREIRAAWDSLRRGIPWRPPPGLTLAEIKAFAKLCGVGT